MKIYLVGGAIRDRLLGYTVHERDWVVVGATPEQMIAQGFIKVGKSFPVFLHPQTKEEYALARTEKKVSGGYYGFECDFSPLVTLEEDLSRRDLTMNAIAIASEDLENDPLLDNIHSKLIDPYHGAIDLKNKILRHISPAFSEDPVRLLRVARFLARFQHLGFTIANETIVLMEDIVKAGEIDTLVVERVWQEFEKALQEPSPVAFIQVLRQTSALLKLLPEIDILYGVPQTAVYHPEIDTGIHTEMVLRKICQLSHDPQVRFGALVHDLGKGATPQSEWPSHKGHEERGVRIIENVCNRLKLPLSYKELGVIVSRYHLHCHRVFELRPDTILKVLMSADAFRRPERFKNFLLICQADAQGRLGLENNAYPQREYFWGAYEAANSVSIAQLIEDNQDAQGTPLKGDALKTVITRARVRAIHSYSVLKKE